MDTPVTEKSLVKNDWLITAIHHDIFIRIFSNLRHDLVGPLSVGLMTISIVNRNLDKDPLDKALIKQQISKIDSQVRNSILAIRQLQSWDHDNQTMANPNEIITHGIQLISSRLTMQDIAIEITASEFKASEFQDSDEVAVQPFLYCWLALLCYFEDNLQQPATLSVGRISHKSLVVKVMAEGAQVKPQHLVMTSSKHSINEEILMHLAQYHAKSFDITPRQIIFRWD